MKENEQDRSYRQARQTYIRLLKKGSRRHRGGLGTPHNVATLPEIYTKPALRNTNGRDGHGGKRIVNTPIEISK